MREDHGEIELAKENKIPPLVTLKDIRGDMQMHSQWSDGNNSILEIAHYVRIHYPQYDYIAITDHSKFMRVAGGIDEKKFMKQMHEIREVNKKLGVNFVKAGAEVDILADGRLDLNDELLEQLDWVTASIHSGFNHDNTKRIIRACENPFVHCIGHPTGRLIGTREGYKVDLQKVIAAAADTGTALEINAQPERMDLNEQWAKAAKEKGVKLVISTDSHQMANFSFMKLGVFIARRAWCTADDILNTHSWKEVHAFAQRKRELVAV
jgi:DNA polymerase (family 10)